MGFHCRLVPWACLILERHSISLAPVTLSMFTLSSKQEVKVGRPVVVSIDPEVNHYILQQEGKLVELWYLDALSKVLALDDGETRMNSLGDVHKYIRNTLLKQFGAESLKQKLLPQMEDFVNKTLNMWCSKASVEVKRDLLAVSYRA
ncbi:Cytochrome P [Trema orientale]|uniref:Cytochrome P n=1 Tax=Trema orientale TaxID=63057 RepID=A0A2P5FW09_TREOI|nr:Cytochrome P [Trema orientale]